MPIIPSYQIPGGIPTRGPEAAPSLDSFPDYRASKMAGAASTIAQTATSAHIYNQHVQGIQDADNLAAKAALEMDQQFKSLLEAPPREKLMNADDGGSEEFGQTAMVVPKSETLVEDTNKLVENMKKKYGALATGFSARYLNPKLDRLSKTVSLNASANAHAMRNQEAEARTLDYIFTQTRTLMVNPVPQAQSVGGTSVIDPNQDVAWKRTRAEVEAKIIDDVKIGAIKPDQGERMREKALAHIDHERAQAMMVSNPQAWNDATVSKTNGWQGKLVGEQMEKLNNRATQLLNMQERKDEHLRKRDAAVIEKIFMQRTSETSKEAIETPLTEQEVIDNSHVLGATRADHYIKLVREIKGGAWGDNPDVAGPIEERATNPSKVTPAIFDEIDAKTYRGGLSRGTATRLKKDAQSILNAKEGKAQAYNFHDYGNTHSAINAATSVPSILGTAIDPVANVVRSEATNKLLEYAQKTGYQGDLGEFYRKRLLPDIISRMGNAYSKHADVLSTDLTKRPEADPKTGIPTPEGITASASAAFKRWGVDPKKPGDLMSKGKFRDSEIPEGLHRELEALEKIKEISDARRNLLRSRSEEK